AAPSSAGSLHKVNRGSDSSSRTPDSMANPSSQLKQKASEASWWHPMDYLRIAYKRRWMASPAFLLVFVSGAVEAIRAVPIFEARTQILIERDGRRQTSIDAVLDDRGSGYYDDGFYQTQYNIIRTRSLALRTIEALHRGGITEHVPAAPAMSFTLTGVFGMARTYVAQIASGKAQGEPAQAKRDTPAAGETAAQ